jgi:periplasmic protein TonB
MSKGNWRESILAKFREPRTQASLFHYIQEKPAPGIWSGMDWSFLRHPLRTLRSEWNEPRTRASLFHYIESPAEREGGRVSLREILADLPAGFQNPLLIGSLFTAPDELVFERVELRNRRMEAGVVSLFIHSAIIGFLILLIVHRSPDVPKNDNVVFVGNPVYFAGEGNGREGGGGGGGGKHEKIPASGGRMPETLPVQLAAPDPVEPAPLVPSNDDMARVPSVQMPIQIAQDQSLPVGDIAAPPGGPASSGPGSGGGIGNGTGTGIGSGSGPGVGPGSGGGMGGGSGGGIGSGVGPYVVGGGVKPPAALYQPLPAYTEDARKARTEGIVVLQAIIRKDGSIDSFKVLRGLGYGLDESAISTIATKWRFKPGTLNGAPVDVQANIEVSFRLY